MSETFESTLETAFTQEHGADEQEAATAAAQAAAYREAYDDDLTAEAFLDAFESSPYAEFAHQFNYVIGDLASANEDCTDSREFRFEGYGDLSADPAQGA